MPADSFSAVEAALRRPPPGPVHLVPFVPAGFGGLEVTADVIRGLDAGGASVIEVGFPFSDPIADGPVIQEAYQRALEDGVKLAGVLDAVGRVRGKVSAPLLAMVSYSLVFRAGPPSFCRSLRRHGFDAVLCPDLPPPEADEFVAAARAEGLDAVLLVSPATSAARRDRIAGLAGGFVYYLSVAGITGQRDALPDDLRDGVADMAARTDLPVCVGFGIGRPVHLRQLVGVAAGAIVGSAWVSRMKSWLDDRPPRGDAADEAERWARSMLFGPES